eukprot:CAMPEP_0170517526 /NCGR_PEP_ID=MMETSP0209-20121228/3493_1 /TAXON_ID=665100 ORGANISM="Litonotus pictus, Strain P1" /NCGR_SAMPLE_ID=MMETSP0209 /ASSEMBLY_ACC=CAM_ASM_000301 /LENGTH=162 /DNA_ID=CAMNT_0010802801 /DNA_START=132 /DNA_END=616 /DNA_ORIENTATION=+
MKIERGSEVSSYTTAAIDDSLADTDWRFILDINNLGAETEINQKGLELYSRYKKYLPNESGEIIKVSTTKYAYVAWIDSEIGAVSCSDSTNMSASFKLKLFECNESAQWFYDNLQRKLDNDISPANTVSRKLLVKTDGSNEGKDGSGSSNADLYNVITDACT